MSEQSPQTWQVIAAVFAGLTSLVTAFFGGARMSRCTLVKTPCFECQRQMEP